MGQRSRGDSVLTAFPEAEVMPSGAPRLAGPPPPFRGVGWKNGARTAPGVGPTETAVKMLKRTMCRGGPEPPTETRTRLSTRSPGGLRVLTPATASGTEEQLRRRSSERARRPRAVFCGHGRPAGAQGWPCPVPGRGGRGAGRAVAGGQTEPAAVSPAGRGPGPARPRRSPSPSSLAVTHSLQQVMSGPFRRDAL